MPVSFSGRSEKLPESNKCPGLNMRQYSMSYISTTYNTLVIKLPANTCTARYPLQLGRLEQCEGSFLLKEKQLLDLSHISQLYSWIKWSNVGKVLAQGNNNKQHHLGIKPGSSGSETNPKPLLLLLAHINIIYCYSVSYTQARVAQCTNPCILYIYIERKYTRVYWSLLRCSYYLGWTISYLNL